MVNKNFKQPTPFLLFKDSQFISCKIPLSSGLVRDEREPLLYPLNNPCSQAGINFKKFKNYASQIEFETLSIYEPTGNNIQGPMICYNENKNCNTVQTWGCHYIKILNFCLMNNWQCLICCLHSSTILQLYINSPLLKGA